MNPKYPIYIPSKGRWESRLTVRALEAMDVPYKIVIEEEEYEQYNQYIDAKNILILPISGQKLLGSRNWIWRRSQQTGDKRHWQIDDNISAFFRINNNLNVPVTSGTIFKCMEDFTDRYENIAVSGPNYFMFIPRKQKIPPYYLNTRIYSCSLINNNIPFRHRRIYNDDTDLCLQALTKGWCTILFNAFNCDKAATMTMKGGNTEDLYLIKDGRKLMTESLVKDFPNLVKSTWKFGHIHHQVDYSRFKKNKLKRKSTINFDNLPEVDNYGMKLIKFDKSL